MRDETTASVETQWARVRGILRAEVGEVAYRSWLKPLTLAGIEDGEVRIAVPTRFMQDWVRTHYAERLRALWKAENKVIRSIEIIIASAAPSRPAAERPAVTSRPDL
ncbi:MAG: DnaA N-terminal domain-containing protein, partial [Acidimicrobiia bacterium]